MKLSKRMMMNVSLIPPSETVADVGCDHGYAGIYLIENGMAQRVIAMDINEGPCRMAKKNIARFGMDKSIEVRLADGLKGLKAREADTVLIAGMGGRLMLRILQDSPDITEKLSAFVLQPQSELDIFRAGIEKMNLHIEDERACKDEGKYYFSMLIKPGKTVRAYNELELLFGPKLIANKDGVLLEYLEERIQKDREIAKNLESKNIASSDNKLLRELKLCEECRDYIMR